MVHCVIMGIDIRADELLLGGMAAWRSEQAWD